MAGKKSSQPTDGDFESITLVDNFYQAAAFIPMSFALVTTVHENGETGIGPHALLYPFSVTPPHSMLLISRSNSGTAVNLRRHGKCALNYVTFDHDALKGITNMGLPGMSLEDKEDANPYTMIKSPTPEKAADPEFPLIVKEAYQVMECTWDDSFGFHTTKDKKGDLYDSHFNLLIDNLYMQKKYVPGIPKGSIFPNMPVFMGFRADRAFWFAEHNAPFNLPLPTVKGLEWQAVNYMANRLDPNVSFTRDACEKLSGIPTPFMKDALQGIVDRALADGVTEVDENYLKKINPQ